MDASITSKTDYSKQELYIQQFKKHYFLRTAIPLGLLLICIIVALFYTKETYLVGMMFFPFLLISSIIFFARYRQQAYLTHYLKSEFILTPDALKLLIKGQQKKEILFKSTITVKTLRLGTYILVGDYNWVDFTLSKYSPIRIPTRTSDIFIPSITENYSELLNNINRHKNSAPLSWTYHP